MNHWWAYRPHPSEPVQLYDLRNDVACEHNLANDHPDVVSDVKRIFREAHEDSRWYANPGESKQEIKAKRRKAENMQRSVKPNTTKSHPHKKITIRTSVFIFCPFPIPDLRLTRDPVFDPARPRKILTDAPISHRIEF